MTHYAEELVCNIYCIDIDYIRPQLACSYVICHQGKAAYIDCGTTHSVPRLLSALKECNLEAADIDYVIPTHIHLDHAGGAGALMQCLPNATLVVHPRGAAHMIDPQRLIDSARDVYGAARFDELYGEIVPVQEQRVQSAHDGDIIDLNGRPLHVADTPGHARHHICLYDELSNAWFTGDTFGLSYPDIAIASGNYLLPTTTPVQFEPEPWLDSIDTLLSKQPERMFLTHYSVVENPQLLAQKLRRDIQHYKNIASSITHSADRVNQIKQKLVEFTLNDLAKLGCSQPREELIDLLDTDITLNAQGLDIWLMRQEKHQSQVQAKQ